MDRSVVPVKELRQSVALLICKPVNKERIITKLLLNKYYLRQLK